MKSSFPKKVHTPLAVESLIERLGGVLSVSGNTDQIVSTVASPREGEEGSFVFCKGTVPNAVQGVIGNSRASVVVAEIETDIRPAQTLIVVEDPLAWYIKALENLFGSTLSSGVDPAARISSTASLGEEVTVGAGSWVDKGCRIGTGSCIGVNCYLGPGTILGENVFIQDNASIGGVGLGYHITKEKERLFFPHLGAVFIEAEVVIGSGTVIVRGELDDTIIGERTRIGNLVNIGHNVTVGEDCAISSGTCVAGGASIGSRCNIAVGVSVNAKVIIEDDCQVGLGSVVTKKVLCGQSVFGCPAKPLRTMKRF